MNDKDKQPQLPILAEPEFRKFVQFLLQNRSSGDFEFHLGLSRRETEALKNHYKLTDELKVKAMWVKLTKEGEAQEIFRAEQRMLAKQARETAQQKLEEATKVKSKKSQPIDDTVVKQEDAQRQTKFVKDNKDRLDKAFTKKEVWDLPEDMPVEQFRLMLMNRGWKFTRDYFEVTHRQVIYMISKLGLKLDLDLIPR